MISPILYRLHSPDLPDMKDNQPNDPDRFCILVQAMIGPSDGSGQESFDFIVCTPSYIFDAIHEAGFLFGKHYLIIDRYNYSRIFDLIDSLCDRVWGANWNEIANKLARYGKWEFEDYIKK